MDAVSDEGFNLLNILGIVVLVLIFPHFFHFAQATKKLDEAWNSNTISAPQIENSDGKLDEKIPKLVDNEVCYMNISI